MAGWEEELTGLLRKLGVEQEQSASYRHPIRQPKQCDGLLPKSSIEFPVERSAGALSHGKDREYAANQDDEIDEEDLWMHDLEIMRHEIDTIVNQVMRLMQRGDLDPTLKEDVMVVMHALRRRTSTSQTAIENEAAYLEFATTMLRFCRLVLQLSEVASEE